MKTLHTIYTNFAKRVLMAIALIIMGVSTAWGAGIATLPVDYSFGNGKGSLPNGVSHVGLGDNYAELNAPYRLKFDNTGDYLQIQVDGAVGKIIFEVKMLGGNSTSYFQLQGSSDGTSFDDIEEFTISGDQDDVITCTTSENIDDSYRYFKFVFTKGSNVGFGKLQLLEVGNNNCEATYDFVNNLDFNTWDTKYTKRVLNYIDAQVIFESADKQQSGSTIADRPVTKGQPVSLVMTDGSTLSGVTWVCQQWSDKAQTITLHYSTDEGESYTSTGVTSSNFTMSSDNLPAGTNAVKITFSSSSNQVGITSCSIEKVCGPTETTITLHPNGGTPNEEQEITTEEESYTLPECPFSRTGYTFDGWATSANGNVIYENKETIENLNGTAVNLYAKWTPIQYDITYNLYGGTNHASNPAKYTIETSAITLQAPTKTGYTFGGWYKEDAFTNPVTQITTGSIGEIILYAKWTPNTYTVQFDANEGTGEMENQSFTYDAEPTALSANIFEREGYNFNSWNTAKDGTGEPYNDKAEVQNLTAAANGVVTLYAQWTAKPLINFRTLCTYEITYEETYGVDHSNPDTYTAANLPLTFTAPTSTRDGYTFAGWSPASLDENTRGDQTVTAQWAAIHTITWMVNGSQAEGDPTTSVVNGQTITTLPTTPDVDCNGKVFVGWTTAEIVGEIATRPDPLYTELGDFPAVTRNMTFYAVFANGEGEGDNKWIETSIDKIGDTDEVVVTMTNGVTTWALNKILSGQNFPLAPVVEGIDGVELPSTEVETEIIWNIGGNSTDGYVFYPKGQTAEWLYCTKSGVVKVGKTATNRFTIVKGFLKYTNSEPLWEGYLAVSTSADIPDWRMYQSNQGVIASNAQTLKFYKKTTVYTSYTNYSTSCVAGEFDITNTDPIYVTSAVEQKIKATDKLVLTTTDMAVGTEISLSAPNITFYKEGVEITQLTTKSAEETFELEIAYQPTIAKITEQPTITLEILGQKFTFNNKISCRSLPENFVIATKVGATWYALPANMNGATNPEGVVIDVDENNMTATAPNTTVYTLFPVATVNGDSDRYKKYGERLRFAAVNNGNRGLWANDAQSGTTINNDAAITAANSTAGAAYEWKITTKIVNGNWQYTLQTDQSNNTRHLRYWTAASGGAKWGTYAYGNEQLYFLPVTTYTDLDLEVMEWGTNSMVIRAGEDLPQNVNITINGTTTQKTLQNINGSDLYKIDDVTLTSDDCGTIIIDNGSNARKIIRKPLLVSGNKSGSEYTTSPGRDICAECDIVILNGGKLIADELISTGSHVDFANIYVYPGGKLVLDDNSLGVKRQVYLRGGYSWLNQETYALPEVYLNGSINFNGSGNIIYDYYIQNYKYYQFALPYTVSLAKVTDEAGVDNFPVWVKHYNGALRAANANATSWEWYSGENFEAGIGYIIAAKPRQEGKVAHRPLSIIRFPLDNSVILSAEADKSIATTAHGIDAYNAGTITANNVGWNFIGNPFMATWKGVIGHQQLMKSPDAEHWNGSYHWENNGAKYITVMSPEDGTDYYQYIAADTELKPFFPFYLQETADGGAGTINFATANRIQKAPAELYADEPREAFVQIEILTDVIEDQTGIFVSDTYSDDIDFDDYEKMFGSSADKSKLWLVHDNKRMAFEAMTETSAAANIALGYRAPKTGSYTFAINEDVSALNEVMGVYLTDHELGVTDYNLLYNTYEFETEAANYNDKRFTIRIVLSDDSNGVVTGVDNIGTMKNGIYKFFYQDKMYIYNNGVIYDGTGKQVTNINK